MHSLVSDDYNIGHDSQRVPKLQSHRQLRHIQLSHSDYNIGEILLSFRNWQSFVTLGAARDRVECDAFMPSAIMLVNTYGKVPQATSQKMGIGLEIHQITCCEIHQITCCAAEIE